MARKKNEEAAPQMKKPKWKVGESVNVTFLGSKYKAVITELKKNKHHIDRWVYSAVTTEGTTLVCIGVNGSEKWANIYTEDYVKPSKEIPKENLETPNE